MLLRVLSLLLLSLYACHNTTDAPSFSTADELPFKALTLTSLDDFQETEATNWRTAGSVYADRQVDDHLQPAEGDGMLANRPDDQNQANLFTRWEHGDVDLSLDFMMAKGSNSGIYLQGRYEVQLLDSWGIDSVSSSDCGGIYERWQEANQQGYEGHAPLLNASRAPGLWQHLDVKFRAPRFDEQGKKIENARFTEVKLNGAVVQKEVEVTGPTRAAAFEDEKPTGPLMIQGDHGPVAIQNIRYKTYASDQVALTDLSYRCYEGDFRSPDALDDVEPDQQAEVDSISHQYGLDNDFYAIAFEGTLRVPTDGEYLFLLRSSGPSWLYLDGKPATDNDQANHVDQAVGRYRTTLQAGTYPLRLVHTKYELKWVRGISLHVEGPQIRRQPLYAESSMRPSEATSPMVIKVDSTPVVQRAFLVHQEDKKTHAAFVGLPDGMNYTVNLQNGSLLSAWKGAFIDASDMWHERGEPQTARPLASPLELSGRPAFAMLSNEDAPWPESVGFEDKGWQAKGYSLNEAGAPVFRYQVGGATIEDHLRGGEAERALIRSIRYQYPVGANRSAYCLLAEGTQIEQLPDGSYGVDGKRYYLTVQTQDAQVLQRTIGGKAQLLAKLSSGQQDALLRYNIVW